MKESLAALVLLLAAAVCAQGQVLVQPVIAAPVIVAPVVPVVVAPQLYVWQGYWVPTRGILGRVTWTPKWVAVPVAPVVVQPQQPQVRPAQ